MEASEAAAADELSAESIPTKQDPPSATDDYINPLLARMFELRPPPRPRLPSPPPRPQLTPEEEYARLHKELLEGINKFNRYYLHKFCETEKEWVAKAHGMRQSYLQSRQREFGGYAGLPAIEPAYHLHSSLVRQTSPTPAHPAAPEFQPEQAPLPELSSIWTGPDGPSPPSNASALQQAAQKSRQQTADGRQPPAPKATKEYSTSLVVFEGQVKARNDFQERAQLLGPANLARTVSSPTKAKKVKRKDAQTIHISTPKHKPVPESRRKRTADVPHPVNIGQGGAGELICLPANLLRTGVRIPSHATATISKFAMNSAKDWLNLDGLAIKMVGGEQFVSTSTWTDLRTAINKRLHGRKADLDGDSKLFDFHEYNRVGVFRVRHDRPDKSVTIEHAQLPNKEGYNQDITNPTPLQLSQLVKMYAKERPQPQWILMPTRGVAGLIDISSPTLERPDRPPITLLQHIFNTLQELWPAGSVDPPDGDHKVGSFRFPSAADEEAWRLVIAQKATTTKNSLLGRRSSPVKPEDIVSLTLSLSEEDQATSEEEVVARQAIAESSTANKDPEPVVPQRRGRPRSSPSPQASSTTRRAKRLCAPLARKNAAVDLDRPAGADKRTLTPPHAAPATVDLSIKDDYIAADSASNDELEALGEQPNVVYHPPDPSWTARCLACTAALPIRLPNHLKSLEHHVDTEDDFGGYHITPIRSYAERLNPFCYKHVYWFECRTRLLQRYGAEEVYRFENVDWGQFQLEIAEWIPYVLSFTRPGMFRTSLFYRKLFKDLHAASRDEPDNEADNHMMTLGWRNAYKTYFGPRGANMIYSLVEDIPGISATTLPPPVTWYYYLHAVILPEITRAVIYKRLSGGRSIALPGELHTTFHRETMLRLYDRDLVALGKAHHPVQSVDS